MNNGGPLRKGRQKHFLLQIPYRFLVREGGFIRLGNQISFIYLATRWKYLNLNTALPGPQIFTIPVDIRSGMTLYAIINTRYILAKLDLIYRAGLKSGP